MNSVRLRTVGGGVASWLRFELVPSRLAATATAGVVSGITEIVLAVSLTALVFTGSLSSHLHAAIGLNLLAAAVFLIVTSVLSTNPSAIGSLQDSTAAILAPAAATVAAGFSSSEDAFLAVVLLTALTSVAAGVVFFALGQFRGGNLVRFVPYPVIGGFLAGTGWLLVKGGMTLLADSPLTATELVRGDVLTRWVPGFAFALVLLVVTRRFSHALLFPGLLIGGACLFYVVLLVSGTSLAAAEAKGWLLGPFPEGGMWRPWSSTAFAQADPGVVLERAGEVVTIVVVAVLALLLNVSGIEIVTNNDADIDRELRASGVANVAAGLAGGMVGFHALSLTALSHRLNALSRLTGIVAGMCCLGAIVLGASFVGFFPTSLLGGLLVFLGLAFLTEWTFDATRKLQLPEYLVVLAILAIIALIGPLQGIAVGLLISFIVFAFNYSRADPVRHELSAATFRSNVDRGEREREILQAVGDQVHVVELQGFLFFGTASSLLARIRARASDAGRPRLRMLVLDFSRVTGVDSSAVMSFARTRTLAETTGCALVFTALGDDVRRRLERGEVTSGDFVKSFPDLDHGMEWCEEQLLASQEMSAETGRAALWDDLARHLDPSRLRAYLVRLELPEGHGLIAQGEDSDDVYFLESGRLSAWLDSDDGAPLRLRRMGPGAIVGEMPIYLRSPRSASVVTDVPSVVHRLGGDAFRRMERNDPELAAALHRLFATLLAYRLTDSSRTVQALLN